MISVKEWAMAKILREQGPSKTEIAQRLGIDRKTVGRVLQREEVPFYPTGTCKESRPRRPSKLDPYKEHIQRRLDRYEKLSATKLHLEIQGRGYQGSYETVKRYVAGSSEPLELDTYDSSSRMSPRKGKHDGKETNVQPRLQGTGGARRPHRC